MSDIKGVVIWGGKGQCAVVTDILREIEVPVLAIFDNDIELTTSYTGLSIRHGRSSFENWIEDREKRAERGQAGCIAAISGVASGLEREELTDVMMNRGLIPTSVIHRSAIISRDADIGESFQMMANAFVGAGAKIGRCCILNTGSSLDHQSVLGNGVHLGPKSVVTGEVLIGNYSFIGANATILPGIRVGTGCIVGAGAVVTHDIADGKTVVGVPARVV
ncbi:NeuD/PglB/VioB family sugar acetyltransferase [Gammaproteobacteria bacterium]|nr:NeuD/PglB/VioB family sugar acetyltransferase [Gammaproteobacteria bacterium]